MLAAIIALRFLFPDTDGIMLFAIMPIALLGMMLGARGGIIAAFVASVAYLLWAAVDAHPDKLDYVSEPLTFFALGAISGYFAHGVLLTVIAEGSRTSRPDDRCGRWAATPFRGST